MSFDRSSHGSGLQSKLSGVALEYSLQSSHFPPLLPIFMMYYISLQVSGPHVLPVRSLSSLTLPYIRFQSGQLSHLPSSNNFYLRLHRSGRQVFFVIGSALVYESQSSHLPPSMVSLIIYWRSLMHWSGPHVLPCFWSVPNPCILS